LLSKVLHHMFDISELSHVVSGILTDSVCDPHHKSHHTLEWNDDNQNPKVVEISSRASA